MPMSDRDAVVTGIVADERPAVSHLQSRGSPAAAALQNAPKNHTQILCEERARQDEGLPMSDDFG